MNKDVTVTFQSNTPTRSVVGALVDHWSDVSGLVGIAATLGRRSPSSWRYGRVGEAQALVSEEILFIDPRQTGIDGSAITKKMRVLVDGAVRNILKVRAMSKSVQIDLENVE